MYEEILFALREQLPEKQFNEIKNRQFHLGIFTEPYLTFMLEGKKIVESRFSKNKILPFEKIEKEDIVIIKKSCGDVVGYFTIKDILFFEIDTISIEEIKNLYQKELCVDYTFWESKKDSRYATLLFIDEIVKLKPFSIHKKGMQTWIKL